MMRSKNCSGRKNGSNKDSIWRTQNDCSLHLRKEFVPPLQNRFERLADRDGYIKTGLIPKGTPDESGRQSGPGFSTHRRVSLRSRKNWSRLKAAKLSRGRSRCRIATKLIPDLLAANKCPDFVEDKGHYFGTDLPDSDKRALIEYLKTF